MNEVLDTPSFFYSKKTFNSLLISVFYFQYGLFLPFSFFANSQFLVVICTSLIILYGLLFHQFIFYQRIIYLILLPPIFLLLKWPFEYNIPEVDILLEFFVSFLTMGLSGILIGTMQFSLLQLKRSLYFIAWFNFLLIFYIPFTNLYGEIINYMRFGYAMLPSVLVAFFFLIGNFQSRKLPFLLFFLSFLELTIYGSRGALLVVLLFCFFTFFIISKNTFLFKSLILIILLVLLLLSWFFLQDIVGAYLNTGLDSYSINKFLYLFEGKSFAESSSGRDLIWEMAIDRISGVNFLSGSPMNSSLLDTGSAYYHNIFLDFAVNFGFIGFLLILYFIFYLLFTGMYTKNADYKMIFLLFLLVPIGRLLVSSSFWQRPDFWFLISFALVNSRSKMFSSRSHF